MTTRRAAIAVGLLALGAGCGRLGFDGGPIGDGRAADGGSREDSAAPPVDAAAPDGPAGACAGGDGTCRLSCLGTDPDCATTCGDGTCVGNAGEQCTACAECNTTLDVCGNGDCSPTEDSDTCYADCGPAPWTWASLDDALLAQVNAARAAGIACGGGAPVVSGPLSMVPRLQGGAHERAWEIAHGGLTGSAPSCNGRTVLELGPENGTTGGFALMLYTGSADPATIVNSWVSNPGLCPYLADAAMTSAGAAIAIDGTTGAALFLD